MPVSSEIALPGGYSLTSKVPFRFHGLYAIGCIFFLLNIVLFLFNCVMISLRFILFKDTFRASFHHPTEGLFLPSAILSAGTILIGMSEYGFPKTGYWFNTAIYITYWIYCIVAILGSCGIYLIL
jgi:tellurite resistance protein TehA-like permease